MLRSEGAIAVIGLAVGVAVIRRSRWSLIVAAGLVGAAVGGVVLDRWFQELIVGVPGVVPSNTLTTGLQGRWDGFYTTWLSTSSGTRESSGTLLWVALGIVAIAAILRRSGRINDLAFAGAMGVLVAAYGVQFLVRPDVLVPGLLVTVPVLWTMAWFVDRRVLANEWDILVVSGVLGVAGILATQYSIGGGVEWGGRYFAVLLPLGVSVVVSGSLTSLRRATPRRPARSVALAASAMVTLLLCAMAFTTLRQGHRWADQLAEGISAGAVLAGPTPVTERPIVMTSNRLLPQLLHEDVDTYDWISADADAIPGFAAQLSDAGADRAVLVVPSGSTLPAELSDSGWTVRAVDVPAVYDVFVMERSES
jgi:hypothetical protein